MSLSPFLFLEVVNYRVHYWIQRRYCQNTRIFCWIQLNTPKFYRTTPICLVPEPPVDTAFLLTEPMKTVLHKCHRIFLFFPFIYIASHVLVFFTPCCSILPSLLFSFHQIIQSLFRYQRNDCWTRKGTKGNHVCQFTSMIWKIVTVSKKNSPYIWKI